MTGNDDSTNDDWEGVLQNPETGSKMHIFQRDGRVVLSEQNDEDKLNRTDAWIRCDQDLLVGVDQ